MTETTAYQKTTTEKNEVDLNEYAYQDLPDWQDVENKWDLSLNIQPVTVNLTNQDIIEFAYAIKEYIEIALGHKLMFEQANCLTSRYHHLKDLLKAVDPTYLEHHPRLKEFYVENRYIDNSWDRLRFFRKFESIEYETNTENQSHA